MTISGQSASCARPNTALTGCGAYGGIIPSRRRSPTLFRMGVTVDFTAFSITQSHHADEYWTYTTTYQNKPVADETGAVGYCSTTGKTCGGGERKPVREGDGRLWREAVT